MTSIRDVWLQANNIIHSARRIINEGLKPLGLTSAEGNILLHLLTQRQVFRQEDIVSQLEISKPAVSRALDSLHKKGYVDKERDNLDKRAISISLTKKAREQGPRIEGIYNRVLAMASRGVKEEQIVEAIQFFALISENLSQSGGVSDDIK